MSGSFRHALEFQGLGQFYFGFGSSVKVRSAVMLCWSCCVLCCLQLCCYVHSVAAMHFFGAHFPVSPSFLFFFFCGVSCLYSSSGHVASSISAYYSLFFDELVSGSGSNHVISSCFERCVRPLLSGYICMLGSLGNAYASRLMGGRVLYGHFLVF